MTSARFLLRDATRSAHERLDAVVAGWDLSDRGDYGRFLQCSAAALFPAEDELDRDGAAALLPDWPERRRRPALAADLAALGLRPPPEVRLRLDGPAEVFGALYVLEGSRLGAKFLVKPVETNPALTEAAAYLNHGAAGMWRSFCDALDASEAVARDPDAAVRGADKTFAAFQRAFEAASEAVL